MNTDLFTATEIVCCWTNVLVMWLGDKGELLGKGMQGKIWNPFYQPSGFLGTLPTCAFRRPLALGVELRGRACT